MHVRVTGLFVILLSGLLTGTVSAGEEAESPLTNAEAGRLLSAFLKAYRPRVIEARVEAIQVLGQHDHPRIAARLTKLLKSRRNAPEIQRALLEALAVQQQAKRKVVKSVAAWLRGEVKETRKRLAGSTPGFRIDPRTGDPDLTSEEGRLVIEVTKSRGTVLREAVRCLRLLSIKPPRDAEKLAVFLQHPHDPLVVETLLAFSEWKVRDALPGLLELYRMYPTERSYDTSFFEAAAKATAAQARIAWVTRFGHPAKRRGRPEVFQALRTCLESITGRAFENPEDLARWMRKA